MIIEPLDRKQLRDLLRMKGQVIAVSLVMACGLTMMIMMRSLIRTLENTRDAYYERNRLADVFGTLKRAPLAFAERIAALPGVAAVEPRVVVNVVLDLPGHSEPATGHIVSLTEDRPQTLNQLYLRRGRLPAPGSRREVVVGEAFAEANAISEGDSITAVLNGRRDTLVVTGIGLSPEFVFEARAGETLPDKKRYGVFWMNYHGVATAFNLDGAFNDYCIDLSPGTAPGPVMAEVDRLLAPYGNLGAYTRRDHASAQRLNDELNVIHVLSVGYPLVFLSVAAFMVNAVLSRLIRLQREQIAQLKAMGFSSRQVGMHFLKVALVIVILGTIVGTFAGRIMGRQLVVLYTQFFRFPSLEFHMDWSALGLALVVGAFAATVGVIGVVRQAVKLPPAEAMRPEPPVSYKPSLLERIGLTRHLTPVMRMALRNIERRPWSALFTILGLALATALMVLPGVMADSIDYLLTYQWNLVQRQDVVVFLNEPGSGSGFQDLRHLPGVISSEPVRSVQARLRNGHHSRKLAITGMSSGSDLNRLLDARGAPLQLPSDGIVMSAKLAEVLDLHIGDPVQVEVQEGARPVRNITVSGLVEDFAGVAAFMDLASLRRFLREGDTINGAYLTVDTLRWDDFLTAAKNTPRAAIVLVKKDQLKSFRDTTGQSIGIVRKLYFVLAMIVAFGVVYNSARIALSERGRDLATLRVIGFTQREVAAVLLIELSLLVLGAIVPGLLMGRGIAVLIFQSLSTETVRMPLTFTSSTYSLAILVVLTAALLSFAAVARMLGKLDLVGVLKARE